MDVASHKSKDDTKTAVKQKKNTKRKKKHSETNKTQRESGQDKAAAVYGV